MGTRRYRRWSSTNWGQRHAAERARVSARYGGVDADVREVFFSLSPEPLNRVLADYREKNGQAAHEYARRVYAEWKSGKVQMSGQVSERLLAIVPRYLSFPVKYALLDKLCRRRAGTRLRVEIAADMTAREALGTALRAIENARSTALPAHILERLHWLADNDGKAAQSLLSQVLAREYEVIVRAVQQELLGLLALSTELAGKPVALQARREIALLGATVEIILNSSSRPMKARRSPVPEEPSNPQGQPSKPSEGALVPAPSTPQGGQIAPIQNPQNLLEEALKRMPPEKQAEVLGKAADEALRLQVKRKENELDLDIVSDKIDQAGRVARDASQNRKADFDFQTEHRSKQGDTRIHIQSKGRCFVVTATYGLRSRQAARVHARCRRRFLLNPLLTVGWCVYRFYGPILAGWSESSPLAFRLCKWLVADPIVRATGDKVPVRALCMAYLMGVSLLGLVLLLPCIIVRLLLRPFVGAARDQPTRPPDSPREDCTLSEAQTIADGG